MEFEWDLRKEANNIRKHRASFIEAVETFSDPSRFALRDDIHSTDEERFIGLAKRLKAGS